MQGKEIGFVATGFNKGLFALLQSSQLVLLLILPCEMFWLSLPQGGQGPFFFLIAQLVVASLGYGDGANQAGVVADGDIGRNFMRADGNAKHAR